jgi:hypothetical protein
MVQSTTIWGVSYVNNHGMARRLDLRSATIPSANVLAAIARKRLGLESSRLGMAVTEHRRLFSNL